MAWQQAEKSFKMNIINLTPHPLTIAGRVIPASGTVARVTVEYVELPQVDGIPAVATTYGNVENLPEATADTIYIVSGMVRSALAGRPDVFAPDTGSTAIRDEAGRIVGVTRLIGVTL